MPTLLPQDSNNNPIPAMRLKPSAAHTLVAGGTSVRNATAFAGETRVISIYADVPVYLAFGGEDVAASASDHYFPAGIYYDLAIGGGKTGQASHVAVLAVATGGNVYFSEKE